MLSARITRSAALLAAAFALLIPITFGVLSPDYNHLRDYISELGAIGTPRGWWVTWLGFLPIGLLTAAVAFGLPAIVPRGGLSWMASLLFLGVSIGYLGAVAWPCDLGCPTVGTPRQQMHNLLGLVEYGLGGVSLLLFTVVFWREKSWRWLAILSAALGAMVLLGLIMMALPQQHVWRGGWQRLAEISLFSWMVVTTWWGTRRVGRSQPRTLRAS